MTNTRKKIFIVYYKMEFISRAPRFRGFQQQDSQELFHALLDGLKSEEIKVNSLNLEGFIVKHFIWFIINASCLGIAV